MVADCEALVNGEVATILTAPEAKSVFEAQGMVPTTSTPQALEDIVVQDAKRWADIVKSRGIQPE